MTGVSLSLTGVGHVATAEFCPQLLTYALTQPAGAIGHAAPGVGHATAAEGSVTVTRSEDACHVAVTVTDSHDGCLSDPSKSSPSGWHTHPHMGA
jgi:hypothetical protein